MKTKDEFDIYEKCVMCGVETTTLKTTHIDFRYGYVDGAGQLCRDCYIIVYNFVLLMFVGF